MTAETAPVEYLTVRWAGSVHRVKVLRRFKNGKIRVEVYRAQNLYGRPGSVGRPVNVTIEPWQVLPDEAVR